MAERTYSYHSLFPNLGRLEKSVRELEQLVVLYEMEMAH